MHATKNCIHRKKSCRTAKSPECDYKVFCHVLFHFVWSSIEGFKKHELFRQSTVWEKLFLEIRTFYNLDLTIYKLLSKLNNRFRRGGNRQSCIQNPRPFQIILKDLLHVTIGMQYETQKSNPLFLAHALTNSIWNKKTKLQNSPCCFSPLSFSGHVPIGANNFPLLPFKN